MEGVDPPVHLEGVWVVEGHLDDEDPPDLLAHLAAMGDLDLLGNLAPMLSLARVPVDPRDYLAPAVFFRLFTFSVSTV